MFYNEILPWTLRNKAHYILGFRTLWVRHTFYRASDCLPQQQHHKVERSLVCVCMRAFVCGRDSRSDLIQDIKMGSCAYCDGPHPLIAERQVEPVSV